MENVNSMKNVNRYEQAQRDALVASRCLLSFDVLSFKTVH
jgi:hypothetical protein